MATILIPGTTSVRSIEPRALSPVEALVAHHVRCAELCADLAERSIASRGEYVLRYRQACRAVASVRQAVRA